MMEETPRQPENPRLHSEPTNRDHKRTTVRFTDDEFSEIKSDAELSGESIPTLLRKRYFQGKKVKLLLSESDRHWVCAELRRIGNNVNQIAKRVNSGVFEGWYSEFSEVTKSISELYHMVATVYGLR